MIGSPAPRIGLINGPAKNEKHYDKTILKQCYEYAGVAEVFFELSHKENNR